MTVVKLIEELQNLPLDAEVICSDQFGNRFRLYDVVYLEGEDKVELS